MVIEGLEENICTPHVCHLNRKWPVGHLPKRKCFEIEAGENLQFHSRYDRTGSYVGQVIKKAATIMSENNPSMEALDAEIDLTPVERRSRGNMSNAPILGTAKKNRKQSRS